MFKRKKITEITTVSQAIQPFVDVKNNLVAVMAKHSMRKELAKSRIVDAQAYAAQVATDETAEIQHVDAEMLQASKIAAALATILGEDPVVGGVAKSEADRVKKISTARATGADKGEGLRKGPDAE